MIGRFLVWIAEEIQEVARQEQAQDRTATIEQLRALLQKLEAGEIDDDEYDRREQELLDRLDRSGGG
jgi:uncharacterized membrane protein